MRPSRLLFLAAGLLVSLASHGQRLLAHYPLDGQVAADVSGNRNDGVWHGGVSATTDRFGAPCSALHFNGRDGYVEVPSSRSLRGLSQQFTATTWCRLDPMAPGVMRWLTLLCKGEGATETPANPQFRVQVLQAPLVKQSTVSINSEFTEFDTNFTAHPIPVGTWFFYALTYDGTTVRTYQNGVEVFAFAYQGKLGANDLPLFIGRDAPGALEFFVGSLDELRLYEGALTPAQVLQQFNSPAPQQVAADFILEGPARRTVDAAPGQCSAVVNFALPPASSPCGPVTVTQTLGLPSGSAFPVGSSILAFQAVSADGAKKTCYTSIKVVDRERPQLACQPDTVITAPVASATGAVWHYAPPAATDNCPNVRVELARGLKSGALFPLGVSEVVFAAIDQQGNRLECRRRVTVKVPPVPVAPVVKAPPVVAPPVLAQVPPPVPTAPVVRAPVVVPPVVTQVAPPVRAPVVPPVRVPAAPPVPAKPVVAMQQPAATAASGRVVKPDSIKPGSTLQFRSCSVTIIAYDGYDEDGDSISLFFQGREIAGKQMIVHKDHGAIIRPLMLNPGEKNLLVVKAWNIGRPGTPNTLKVEFIDGYYTAEDAKKMMRKTPMYIKTMDSLPGLSDSINLTCKQQ